MKKLCLCLVVVLCLGAFAGASAGNDRTFILRFDEGFSLALPEGYIKGTVGAGDAFCSGMLYGAWRGMDLAEAIELGTAAAACSLSQPGGTEGMRDWESAMALYRTLRQGG